MFNGVKIHVFYYRVITLISNKTATRQSSQQPIGQIATSTLLFFFFECIIIFLRMGISMIMSPFYTSWDHAIESEVKHELNYSILELDKSLLELDLQTTRYSNQVWFDQSLLELDLQTSQIKVEQVLCSIIDKLDKKPIALDLANK